MRNLKEEIIMDFVNNGKGEVLKNEEGRIGLVIGKHEDADYVDLKPANGDEFSTMEKLCKKVSWKERYKFKDDLKDFLIIEDI